MDNWFLVENIDQVDSPGLLIYPDRVKENIRILKSFVDNVSRLRPHVKTNKSPDITRMLVSAGINKFKCATIAEAEMLAMNGAADVLLAHQPVGPKVERFKELIKKYPKVHFSCLIDDAENAKALKDVDVYIDLNVGMNRTGIEPEKAIALYSKNVIGLHAYDGHLREPDLAIRTKQCDEGFARVLKLQSGIEKSFGKKLPIVAGGTPSFPIHAKRKDIECSPGTFIYWDMGYHTLLKEQPFLFAALVVTRVISIPTSDTICVDLGHKGIAAENPLDKRVYFLNAEGLIPVGQSEEHLVLKVEGTNNFKVGDVLYGVPHHICPTVNLYDAPNIIENGRYVGNWETVSRKRKIIV
ncbi:MAG TPA: D-TA family PLP-dependent enzyme [Cyclobacteriaceae bacterium]|nr:D-TA family PLP-dependent enzyme [Cyclobacteriaceae bacterium]